MYMTAKAPYPPREFHDRIYAGEILRFQAFPEMRSLMEFTREFLEDAFFPHAPPEIHKYLSHERQLADFAARQGGSPNRRRSSGSGAASLKRLVLTPI
jgi:hypothetical protein